MLYNQDGPGDRLWTWLLWRLHPRGLEAESKTRGYFLSSLPPEGLSHEALPDRGGEEHQGSRGVGAKVQDL